MEGGAVGHNFEMGLPKDYPSQIWFSGFREEDLNVIFYQTRYDYNLTIMKSPKPATDNRFKK